MNLENVISKFIEREDYSKEILYVIQIFISNILLQFPTFQESNLISGIFFHSADFLQNKN
jgi:hypothetical protein